MMGLRHLRCCEVIPKHAGRVLLHGKLQVRVNLVHEVDFTLIEQKPKNTKNTVQMFSLVLCDLLLLSNYVYGFCNRYTGSIFPSMFFFVKGISAN